MTNEDTSEELFEDIDFMEQPGESPNGPSWVWLAAGAAVGLGVLYLLDPQHGERRRTRMTDGCRSLGRSCQDGLSAQVRGLKDRLMGKATDFQAEIRSRAPQYLQ